MKFEAYTYWLNEKFTEDSDPIHDLGIGIFHKRVFDNQEEVYEFLYNIVCGLFHVNDPMEIISKDPTLLFKKNILKELQNYCREYITVKDYETIMIGGVPYYYSSFGFEYLRHLIIQRNKEKQNESLNEKFTEDSDPIHDLGIGIFSHRNFKTEKEALEWIYIVIPTVCKVNKCIDAVAHPYKNESPAIKQDLLDLIYEYYHAFIKVNGRTFYEGPWELKKFIEEKTKNKEK